MIEKIMKKMIDYSNGSLHDINHLLKVHSYARTIGMLEGIDEEKQLILEISAIVHDIACPMLREKYGIANGKLQEKEGTKLAEDLLKDTGLSEKQLKRISFLVGHHHTLDQIDDIDYQILIEADYLVNADESSYSKTSIENAYETIYKTNSGKALLKSIYLDER